MLLPHILCPYSMYQMNLNSFNVIWEFFHLNSGLCLYLSNSSSHSAAVVGGGLPRSVQSVILSPDSVNLNRNSDCKSLNNNPSSKYLVTPPRTTAPTHIPAQPASHHPTWLRTLGGQIMSNNEQLTARDAAMGSVLPIAGEIGIAKVIYEYKDC